MSSRRDRDRARNLRRRIVDTSTTEVMIDEIESRRFFPQAIKLDKDFRTKSQRLRELRRDIDKLQADIKISFDVDKLKKEITEERKKASLIRREKRKQERIVNQKKRKKLWEHKLKTTIVSIGRGYSTKLDQRKVKSELIDKYQIPKIKTVDDLLSSLDISLSQLKWLTFHRDATTINHYVYFEIPKKTGGYRKISAPKPLMASCQKWILDNILIKIPIHQAAHGFIGGKSILTNAKSHLKKAFLINMDLKDFFPSITFFRIRGVFLNLGYSGEISTLLASICSEPTRAPITVKSKSYFVSTTERHLPQGACTSPAITNILCWKLDRKLSSLAESLKCDYSRYADDISLSGDNEDAIGKLIGGARRIIKEENFMVNNKKTRILKPHRRQEVTGIVVNSDYNIPRKWVRSLRAKIHQYSLHQMTKKSNNEIDEYDQIQGMISYLHMVDPEKALKMRTCLD